MNRCSCGRFLGFDGCGKCLEFICQDCKKHTKPPEGGSDDNRCDTCWYIFNTPFDELDLDIIFTRKVRQELLTGEFVVIS